MEPGKPPATGMTRGSLSAQLREKRSELMTLEIESVALDLFEQHGYATVTVEDIASAAHTSARTFYRYFPTKSEILQLRVEQRADALERALEGRPANEPPLRAIRFALASVFEAEGADLVRRWMSVVASDSDLVRAVMGSVQLRIQNVLVSFLAQRLGEPPDALRPTMIAAAVGGVAQASLNQWYRSDRDLPTTVAEALEVLEHIPNEHVRET